MVERVRACERLDDDSEAKDDGASNHRGALPSKVMMHRPNAVAALFLAHFERAGYAAYVPLPLISPVDPTTRFVGSAISSFKPIIRQLPVDRVGHVLVQPALRTQNSKLLTGETCPQFASSFLALGTISPPDRLVAVCEQGCLFITATLGLPTERLVLRMSSHDLDLRAAVARLDCGASVSTELDGCPVRAYRHVYGDPELRGRNMNFGVRHGSNGRLRDAGNLVVIESENGVVAIELAFGATTLLSRLHDREHPLQCDEISTVMRVEAPAEIKMADALVVTVQLLRLGLRPIATNRGRILRQYAQSISALRRALGWSLAAVLEVAGHYEDLLAAPPVATETRACIRLYRYLEAFERAQLDGVPARIANELASRAEAELGTLSGP